MHALKLALNKSMRASDNEQGINKLGNKEIETSRVTKEKVSVEVKQYKKNISKQKLNRNVHFIQLVLLLIKKLVTNHRY